MNKKRFLLPWENKYTMTCSQCGRKIDTYPLWFWERKEDKIRELQPLFCHTIDLTMISQIPTLSPNDWDAGQKWNEFRQEFVDENGQLKPREVYEHLLVADKGPPEIFLRHGIFPLISFFNERALKALFLVLCLEQGYYVKQAFFLKTMRISSSYVSTILKEFNKWKFLNSSRGSAVGRARGRQRVHAFKTEVRARLEKDLADFEFFRNAVRTTVRPIALNFSELHWRKDLGLLDRENEQPSIARSSGIG